MTASEHLRREIETRGLSVTDAAAILKIGRPALSNALNGNAALSISLALKLEARFGLNARQLLIAQLDYDIAVERRRMRLK